MNYSTASFASAVVAIVGGLILWANPRRWVNRSVFACSTVVSAWLLFSHWAVVSEARGLFWVRWTCGVGALAPLTLWMVKESILGNLNFSDRRWLLSCALWPLLSVLLAVLPFTEAFIPSYSTDAVRVVGWGYYAYYGTLVALCILLLRDAIRRIKSLTGGARLELQIWLYGGCTVVAVIYSLIGLSAVTGDPLFRRMQPLAVLFFYAGTSYAITTHRILDARQLVLLTVEKGALVVGVALSAYLSYLVFGIFLSETPAFLATTIVSLWLAALLNNWLDRRFKFFPHELHARQAAFAAAQKETRVEGLERSFTGLLKGWGQTERALILSGRRENLAGAGVELRGDSLIIDAMRRLQWATPERLVRERPTVERAAVAGFLDEQKLGVVVMAEGPALSLLVGVGVGASRRPFTYPQVTQLVELASIMESALERAHFSAKVQHTEQLATVGLLGASLAHEIRNPLVSIKTFVQLLPTHHHDPAFREKFFRLIGDEVGRIDQLTEQLLDLASPRTYSAALIELHPVLRATVDLVAAKAAHKSIQFMTEFDASPDQAFTDPSAAKQVMINLCFNAIQAVEAQPAEERWVRVATRNTANGIEMTVADSGPGIAPEIRPRLFQPFQTTKSSGFGLGLAICSDILANLNASIAVDPLEPGRGATFRVTFPCQPLSS